METVTVEDAVRYLFCVLWKDDSLLLEFQNKEGRRKRGALPCVALTAPCCWGGTSGGATAIVG